MEYLLNKRYDGTFTMNFIGSEESTQQKDVKIFTTETTIGIKSIISFNDTQMNTSNSHYFEIFFSYRNGRSGDTSWTEQIPITGMTNLELCPLNEFELKIYYYRIDTDTTATPTLTIKDIIINGTYDIEVVDENAIISGGTFTILEPKDIYKIFDLTGYEIYGLNTEYLAIKYRFTQNGGISYTDWEILTNENIGTVKLNELRFAQVQYSITMEDDSPVPTALVYDIVLTGDFQNVSANYLKTNRYGLKEDCATRYINGGGSNVDAVNGVCISGLTSIEGCGSDISGTYYNYNRDWYTQFLSCYLVKDVYEELNYDNNVTGSNPVGDSGFWNPYEVDKITQWYLNLANQTNKIFGWDVDYFRTDPDSNGIDMFLHEYQLFNVTDTQQIKVIIPDNQFPDNQVQINEFSLDLFDTFEIHVLKDEFKRAFGIEKRPAQKDIIYICQANRLYRIKHAQIHKDIMYMGIYYKVILEKYEQLANEQILSQQAKNLITPLTDNTTINEIFGFENRQDMDKIANKQQQKPLTHDELRVDIDNDVAIMRKKIYNHGVNIAESYYNMKYLTPETQAVTYSLKDRNLEVSDNRSYTMWINFNNLYSPDNHIDQDVLDSYDIPDGVLYEFLRNYDMINNKGYRLWYSSGDFGITINNESYSLETSGITTNIWYGLSISINQRLREAKLSLFKRNCDYYIKMFNTTSQRDVLVSSLDSTGITYYTSNGYVPVTNIDAIKNITNPKLERLYYEYYSDIEPQNFSHQETISLYSSNSKITNIRIFDDILDSEITQSNILNEYIVSDSNRLILGDNANRKLYTSNIPNKRWE